MADLPDAVLLHVPGTVVQFLSHPHSLALLPDGLAASALAGADVSAVFLVDRDCGFDTLNGAALAGYLTQRVPVRVHAQRARDLRPFLRRSVEFQARGYAIAVMP